MIFPTRWYSLAADYPSYDSKTGFPNYKGGICNDATAGVTDEEDIAWVPYTEGVDF